MNKEYTVKEFVEKYVNLINDTAKAKFLEYNLFIKNYIPVNTKVVHADLIAKNTSFDKDSNFKVNSPARLILGNLECINLYTNITVDFKNMDTEYDLLKTSGIYDYVIEILPEKDVAEFCTFIDLSCSDLERNYNSPHAYVSREVEKFGTLIGVSATPILNKISDEIENLDEEKTDKIAKAIGKFGEKLFKK